MQMSRERIAARSRFAPTDRHMACVMSSSAWRVSIAATLAARLGGIGIAPSSTAQA